MLYTAEKIRGLRERHDTAIRSHHRATRGADDELNARLDALTALLSADELRTIVRYLEREGGDERE